MGKDSKAFSWEMHGSKIETPDLGKEGWLTRMVGLNPKTSTAQAGFQRLEKVERIQLPSNSWGLIQGVSLAILDFAFPGIDTAPLEVHEKGNDKLNL